MYYEVVVMDRCTGLQEQRSDPHRWEFIEQVYLDYLEEYDVVTYEVYIEKCE